MRLEELTPGSAIRGLVSNTVVSAISTQWHGSYACTLVYRGPNCRVTDEILCRHNEPRLELVEHPVLSVHASLVDPPPHQITAVYDAMLPQQPLRFLLANDPGADSQKRGAG